MSKTATQENSQKKAALTSALAQIEKQFGKGSIMRMGDREVEKTEIIPTGSMLLDVALGIGGLPRGRIVEIYGPEASGKCLTKDTYLWTERGMETIEEIFNLHGQQASCTSRITDIQNKNFYLVNEQGKLEKTLALTHNYRREVFRVNLESGRFVEGTHNHPLRVINERGQIVWKNIGNIEAGDHMVSALFGAENERKNTSDLTEKEALLLGYLVSEGSFGPSSKNAIHFSNHDADVVEEYKKLCHEILGVTPVSYDDNKEHFIHNKAMRQMLHDKYGLDFVKSAGKDVPFCVRTAPASVQKAFLSSLFEGDGAVEEKRGVISYSSASEKLAREVQLMLMGFGVPSTLRSKKVKGYDDFYWEIGMGPSAAQKFVSRVGFRSPRRAQQVAASKQATAQNSYMEAVPNFAVASLLRDLRDHVIGDRAFDDLICDILRKNMNLACHKSRLRKIVAWFDGKKEMMLPPALASLESLRHLATTDYTYEIVKSVESQGEKPTFDVALGQTHSFLANGILSHNTTLTLHAIAECQKQGGTCAFIDAEHALDPVYAQKLGINLDDLLLSQPDTGEQALEIVETLVSSGAVDLIVVDSVAALTPRAEIDGEMGDSLPGLQARLMSQAMRKITGAIKRSNTTVIFINQLRMKIGIMMPGQSPETTTGGNALKFYASVRLDIRRIGSIKKGDEILGNQVRIKVVKNKMAPPFKQVVSEIIFGQGISKEGELIELASDNKVIEKSGSWYSYDNAKIGQGKEQVREYLKQNPEIFEKIKKETLSKVSGEELELGGKVEEKE